MPDEEPCRCTSQQASASQHKPGKEQGTTAAKQQQQQQKPGKDEPDTAAQQQQQQQFRTPNPPRPLLTWRERNLLVFWPWFVECAFQKQYYQSTLSLHDSISLPLDAAVWILNGVHLGITPWLLILPPLVLVVSCWTYKQLRPDRYARRRATLTAIRRLCILPYLSLVLLRRPVLSASSRQAAVLQVFVVSGALHNILATFLFLNSLWARGVVEIIVGAVVLASAAPSGCRNILSGPHPDAGWPLSASLMDRSAFSIYSSSLKNSDMAHAVCCTTLNTTLVVCSCLAAYLLHWFERTQRLRFKTQVPPAVAAMQAHVYGLPTGLVAAQGLLLLLYPAMVLSWVALGAFYGLSNAAGPPVA